MATNYIIEKVAGSDSSSNRIASTFYCTCSTAAATAQKDATVADSCTFNDNYLVTGVTVHVKFTNSNTHATPTLKVGTATAKQIMAYGTTKPGTTATASWYAGSVVSFTYDGTYWVQNDYKSDTNTQTVSGVKGDAESSYRTGNVNLTAANIGALASDTLYAGASTAGGAATSANKLNTDAGSMLNPVYFSNGIPVASSGDSIPFIVGTGSTAGTWLGTLTGLAEYYDGLLILYKPSVAGASTTTLNLNNLGAKTCYLNSTTKLTTHYPANQPILLVYSSSQNSGCWEAIDNYDSNSNTYDRNRYQASIKAGSSALVAANIIVGKDGVFNHLKSGGAFDISYPILYLNEAVAATKTTTNTYDIIHFTVTTTQSISLTAYKPVYIKGSLSGNIFTPISTTPLTQTGPMAEDGYHYILLGIFD